MTTIIVAHDENRVIGNKGDIPWHLSEDLQQFKRRTTNTVVVMGRKTWESIPEKYRPLSNRINIVVTSLEPKEELPKDTLFIGSLESALNHAKLYWPEKDVFIIGGGQIYRYALANDLVDCIIATIVHGVYEGDTYFPSLDGSWEGDVVMNTKDFTIMRFMKI